jgi:aspartyl protease family protein
MRNILYFAIVSMLSIGSLVSAAVQLEVVALFENKALLLINNKKVLLSVGDSSEEGITLISANAKQAVIEVDGVKKNYTLGNSVRFSANQAPQTKQDITVYRNQNNLFTTVGSINGFPVNMLVDTGASAVAISSKDAKRLGINYKLDGVLTNVTTASGIEQAYQVRLDKVSVGTVTLHSIQGLVIEGDQPDTPLLGMSFLSRFNIINDGQIMTLKRKF